MKVGWSDGRCDKPAVPMTADFPDVTLRDAIDYAFGAGTTSVMLAPDGRLQITVRLPEGHVHVIKARVTEWSAETRPPGELVAALAPAGGSDGSQG